MLRVVLAFLCSALLISAVMMFATPAHGEQRDPPCSFQNIPFQPRPDFQVKCDRDHDLWPKNCDLQPAT